VGRRIRLLVQATALLIALAPAAAPAQLIAPLPPSGVRLPEFPAGEPPPPAPWTFTPSLTISEEFNDNIFLDNRMKESDFITSFAPGLALTADTSRYHFLSAYSFRADIYAKNPSLNDALNRQSFVLDASYRFTPGLTVTFNETFFLAHDTNLTSPEGVATGRTRSYTNVIEPGVRYQIDTRNTVRALANYTILRFSDSQLFDSAILRIEGDFDHAFTRRLMGTTGYQFGRFDVKGLGVGTAHTPLFGLAYRITETLTGAVKGGPSFVHDNRTHDDRVTPTVSASLVQSFRFGTAALIYDR